MGAKIKGFGVSGHGMQIEIRIVERGDVYPALGLPYPQQAEIRGGKERFGRGEHRGVRTGSRIVGADLPSGGIQQNAAHGGQQGRGGVAGIADPIIAVRCNEHGLFPGGYVPADQLRLARVRGRFAEKVKGVSDQHDLGGRAV